MSYCAKLFCNITLIFVTIIECGIHQRYHPGFVENIKDWQATAEAWSLDINKKSIKLFTHLQ